MSRSKPCPSGLLFAPLLMQLGCATVGAPPTDHAFARRELDALPFERLEVVLSVGTATASGDPFDVAAPPTPSWASRVALPSESTAETAALARALATELAGRGFVGRVVSSATVAVPFGGAGAAAPRGPLARGATPSSVATDSDADVVLVVRALPLDRFYLDRGEGFRIVETPLGREQVVELQAEAREGRLYVAQAFGFERTSGVRLWSRQAPGYPSEGHIPPKHPFLAMGWVAPPNAPTPTAGERATRGGPPFAAALFEALPAPHPGDAAVRAALAGLEPAKAEAEARYFERGQLTLDVAAGWHGANQGADLALFDGAAGALDTAAWSPRGAVRGQLRVGYLTSSAWFFGLSGSVGRSDGGLSRVYVDPRVRFVGVAGQTGGAAIDTHGATSVGGALEVGPAFVFDGRVVVIPRGSAWVEVTALDATPTALVVDPTRASFGVGAALEAWWALGERFFLRGSGELRVGVATAGPASVQGLLLVGVGARL
jgi:hypothetical protein